MVKFILKRSLLLRAVGIGIFIYILNTNRVSAQNSSFEFWPETDIWYRLSPSWRLSAFIPLEDYANSKPTDLNVYLQADYAWGHTKKIYFARLLDENRAQQMKAWLARGAVMRGLSLGEDGDYYEDAIIGEIHRRLPLGDKTLLSARLRSELRWLGKDNQFSYRIRYRVMIEKEVKRGNASFVPYVNAEPYWDSRYTAFTRIRLIGGTTITWRPRFALEGNLTYQYDEYYDTENENLYALNVILHIYFERKTEPAKTH
ncbi:MAG: DUF2490 domain-containing protein [Bacteroidota bacterium]